MTRPRNFDDILSKIPGARKTGDSWLAPCPAPGHRTPQGHLSLKDTGDKALVTCHGGRHIAQRIVVPAEVVVVDEVGNSLLQLSGEFISDLVYFPLDGQVVALQFPVGLRMEGRRLDMSDANEVQIVPKSSGDVTRPVVREQFGAVLDRDISHAGSINRFLDHLDEGVGRHITLQLPGQDEAGIVVHNGHEVIVALNDRLFCRALKVTFSLHTMTKQIG